MLIRARSLLINRACLSHCVRSLRFKEKDFFFILTRGERFSITRRKEIPLTQTKSLLSNLKRPLFSHKNCRLDAENCCRCCCCCCCVSVELKNWKNQKRVFYPIPGAEIFWSISPVRKRKVEKEREKKEKKNPKERSTRCFFRAL